MTIAVIADKNVRAERISDRDGISIDAAMNRINSQKPDDYYISNTNAIIQNDSDIEALSSSLNALLEKRGVRQK